MPKYHPRLSPSNLQSLLAQREKFQSHRHGWWGYRNPSLVMQPSLMLATGCVCCRGPVASQTVQPRHRPSYEIALPFQHKHCGTSMQVGKNLDVWVSESQFWLSDIGQSHTQYFGRCLEIYGTYEASVMTALSDLLRWTEAGLQSTGARPNDCVCSMEASSTALNPSCDPQFSLPFQHCLLRCKDRLNLYCFLVLSHVLHHLFHTGSVLRY